jgi:hypothetical protein
MVSFKAIGTAAIQQPTADGHDVFSEATGHPTATSDNSTVASAAAAAAAFTPTTSGCAKPTTPVATCGSTITTTTSNALHRRVAAIQL